MYYFTDTPRDMGGNAGSEFSGFAQGCYFLDFSLQKH